MSQIPELDDDDAKARIVEYHHKQERKLAKRYVGSLRKIPYQYINDMLEIAKAAQNRLKEMREADKNRSIFSGKRKEIDIKEFADDLVLIANSGEIPEKVRILEYCIEIKNKISKTKNVKGCINRLIDNYSGQIREMTRLPNYLPKYFGSSSPTY